MSEDRWRNNSRGYTLIHKSIDFHINPKKESFKEGRVSEREENEEGRVSRKKNLINEEMF